MAWKYLSLLMSVVLWWKMLVLTLKDSSMIRLCRRLLKSLVICSLLRKKFLTLIHLTGVLRSQSSGGQYRSGLPLYLNSVKKFWTKLTRLNSILNGGKYASTIWFVTGVTGLSLVSELGEFHFQSSMPKTEHQSWQQKPSNTWLSSLRSTALSSGGSVKQKTSYQKDLLIQVLQMANLPRKRISWTFGLTQVHHGMV